jgi:FKBP-type peptidyl-prolyl cis-trans isomerase FkpA
MKKNLMFLALAAAALASCNGGFKKGEGGLLYNIHTDKSTPVAQVGDFASLNVVAKNDGDSVLFSTYDSGHPQYMLMQKPAFKGDIYSGLLLLSEGDSATIKLSADSVFKQGQRPPNFKGKYIIYDVKVEKIVAKGKLTDQVFQDLVTTYIKAETEAVKTGESKKIENYIAGTKLNYNKTASGLRYIITKPGSGPTIAANDTAVVRYVGRFFNGKLFDTSIKAEAEKAKMVNPQAPYEPIRFAVGQSAVIPGWDEAMQLLNKGAKASLVVPSNLAYGEQGNQLIPPFTPLTFEIEIVDIVKGVPPTAVK